MRPSRVETHTVRLFPKDLKIEAASGTTLTDALAGQNIRTRVSCRNGVCGICKAQLLSGTILYQETREIVDAPATILPCRASPVSDLQLYVEDMLLPAELPVRRYSCQVIGNQLVNRDVHRVLLRLPAGVSAEFHAGQYLEIVLDEDQRCALSIGCSPTHTQTTREIELHFRPMPDYAPSARVLQLLEQPTIEIEMPKGNCFLAKSPDRPVILLAGSTGFSQMKSIAEYVIAQNIPHSLHIYWGGRTADDLYLAELPQNWAKSDPNISYTPVISDETHNLPKGARTGLVHEAVVQDFPNLSNHLVYASGSPGMVYSAYDAFLERGMSADVFLSDVFDYAPR